MTFSRFLTISAILAYCIFLSASGVFAQAPSLAAADQYEVTVKNEYGEEETFTILRDGRMEEQFYYLPIQPVVACKVKDGKKTPVFQLLSYQTKNDKDELVQGGILELSMVMGVSQKTREEILKKIRRKFIFKDYSKQHRLSPMPIKKAEIAVYDLGGNLLDQAPPKTGIAPIFGNQHYPFMLRLKSLGTDVMEALCRKQGGLPVLVTYTFSGMTPKVGFEVEVDWDACYKHFSTDTNVAISAVKNAIGGGLGLDISTLREEFESKGMIKINSLGDETVTSEQLDELMSPVLNLITVELFQQLHCPTGIDPAAAREIKEATPEAQMVQTATRAVKSLMGKAFFSANVQVNFALKDAKIVKKGKFNYNFHRQSIIDRTSAFGGLLGIGEYPKEIQDKCVTIMPAGKWEAAFFTLPSVGDPEALGLKTVAISVTPEEMKGSAWQQISGLKIETAIFNSRGQPFWTNKDNQEVNRFLFPLKSLYAQDGFKTQNYRFKIDTHITPASGKSFKVTTYAKMFDGDLALSDPGDVVDLVNIDGTCLTFGENEGEVYRVVGMLKSGKNTSSISLSADQPNKTFLVPADKNIVTIESLTFTHKKGKLGVWKDLKKNLRELEPSLQFLLFDYDWVETPPEQEKLPENALIPSPL